MAKTRFTSPIGRLVQGSVDEPQTKDAQGNLRVVKTGPNVGQPNPQYFVGVAFPKADPQGEFKRFWGELARQAAADFPGLFQYGADAIAEAGCPQPWFSQPPAGQQMPWIAHPQFSFKVVDGDGLDQNGKLNSAKEGFAGHWVVRFGSAYPPRCFHAGRYAANEQIQETNAIKRGYFVRINGSIDGNGNAQRPGLYVNLDMVELAAYGPEIVSGPDAESAFAGGAPASLPAGASATPIGAGSATPPAYAPPPVAPAAPPIGGATFSVMMGAPPPVAPAAPPYAGYMAPPPGNGASSAVVPAPPAPPPISAGVATPSLTEKAAGYSYEQLIAAGWNDETLRASGYIA